MAILSSSMHHHLVVSAPQAIKFLLEFLRNNTVRLISVFIGIFLGKEMSRCFSIPRWWITSGPHLAWPQRCIYISMRRLSFNNAFYTIDMDMWRHGVRHHALNLWEAGKRWTYQKKTSKPDPCLNVTTSSSNWFRSANGGETSLCTSTPIAPIVGHAEFGTLKSVWSLWLVDPDVV